MAQEKDKEVNIQLEDQQKINRFARLNNRLDELKDDKKAKENEIQTLEDASTDLMMLDDEQGVPYQVGEVFVNLTQDEAQSEIETRKEQLEKEVKELEGKMDVVKGEMSDMKSKLYAKFGSSINLENDEE